MEGVGLGQVIKVLGAAAEVLLFVGSMPHGELPAFIQTDGFTNTRSLGLETQQCQCK